MVASLLSLYIPFQSVSEERVVLPQTTSSLEAVASAIKLKVPKLTINVPTKLSQEIVWVQIKERSVREIVDLLAKALKVEVSWISSSRVDITIPKDWERKIREEELGGRIKRLRAGTGDRGMVAGLPTQAVTSLSNPKFNLLWMAISKIAPEILAELEPGERRVFSTHPTNLQLPLKGLESYFSATPAWLREPLGQFDQIITPTSMPMMRQLSFNIGNPALGLGKISVVVQRRNTSEALSVQLLLLDTNGGNLGSVSQMLFPKSDRPVRSQKIQPLKFEAKTLQWASALRTGKSDDYVASVGGESGLSMSVRNMGTSGPNAPLENSERSFMTNLRAHEPLSLVSSVLSQISPTDEVIAWLPDESLLHATKVINDRIPVGAKLASENLFDFGLLSTTESGVNLITPIRPWTAISQRANRVAITKLLGSVEKNRLPTIDSLLEFATVQKKAPTRSDLDGLYFQALGRAGLDDLLSGETGSYPLLRFLGSLSAGARSYLSQGGEIQTNLLSPAQQRSLHNDVFQADECPILLRPGTPPVRSSAMMSMSGVNPTTGRSESSSISIIRTDDERTDLLPNGISNSSSIRVKIETEEAALRFMREGFDEEILNPFEVSMLAVNRGGKVSLSGSYLPVLVYHVTLTYQLREKVVMNRSLKHFGRIPGAEPGKFEQLPETFQNEVLRQLQKRSK